MNRPADPGLAQERTRLAWRRSAISFAALGAAVAKTDPAAGVPIIAIAFLVWIIDARAARSLARGGPTARRLTMAFVTATTVLIAIGALAIAAFSSASPLR